MRLDRSIKAGQYSFRLGTSVPALLRSLARGMSGLNLITIPEGLTAPRSGGCCRDHLGVPRGRVRFARSRPHVPRLARCRAPSIEGYLAPDSYEFLPGTSPEVAFRTMAQAHPAHPARRRGRSRFACLSGSRSTQLLVLASIVEAEAQFADERARIARVYLNRLAAPHAAPGRSRPSRSARADRRARDLLLKDLQSPSPYNTYLHDGLPPGPICNPGRSSIEATLEPDRGQRGPLLRRARRRAATSSRAPTSSTFRTSSARARSGRIRRGWGHGGGGRPPLRLC